MDGESDSTKTTMHENITAHRTETRKHIAAWYQLFAPCTASAISSFHPAVCRLNRATPWYSIPHVRTRARNYTTTQRSPPRVESGTIPHDIGRRVTHVACFSEHTSTSHVLPEPPSALSAALQLHKQTIARRTAAHQPCSQPSPPSAYSSRASQPHHATAPSSASCTSSSATSALHCGGACDIHNPCSPSCSPLLMGTSQNETPRLKKTATGTTQLTLRTV
jgi:hypothetical protein